MSEVSGPPDQKGLKPVMRVPEISKHDQKPDDRKPPEQQEQQSAKPPERQAQLTRDPAVSLSASVGHIALGENIEGSIISIDADGRPILITPEATFALTPDAGLQAGDTINLNVVTTDHKLKAELTIRNGKPEIPPILLTMTLVSVKHIEQTTTATPQTEDHYLNEKTGAYIPPATAPVNNPAIPQTSLSSGVYNPTLRQEPTTVAVQSTDKDINMLPKPLINKKEITENIISKTKQPPDPTMVQSSTSDMATLLVTQQVSVPGPAPVLQPEKEPAAKMGVTAQKSKADGANVSQQKGEAKVASPKAVVSSQQARYYPSPNLQKTSPQPTPQAKEHALEKSAEPAVSQPTIAATSEQMEKTVATTEGSQPTTATVLTTATHKPDESVAISNPPIITATFIPGKQAQAILAKANIPSVDIVDKVDIILRAKQNQDPPQALEVKIISVYEISNRENTDDNKIKPPVPNTKENTADPITETKKESRAFHVETSGGAIEFSLHDGQSAPKENEPITLFVALPEATPALNQTMTLPGKTKALSLLSQGLKGWPALQKTHELITTEKQGTAIPLTTMQQISQTLTSRTANGGARLTNSLLFMLAALKQGNASNWLGPQVEKYLQQSNQQPLIDMLKQDITRFAGLINQPAVTSEWQPMVLPLAADDNSILMALLVRPEHPPHSDKEGNNSDQGAPDEKVGPTRFIIEVHFSNIGDIQLDGFIKEKNFDLKFRSITPLAEQFKNDIRSLFSSSLDANGFNGSITFYDMPSFPVDVADIINDVEPVAHSMQNV